MNNSLTHKKLGFGHQPSKCPAHRGPKVCFKWRDDGDCPYGDACSFDHPSDAKGKGSDYVSERSTVPSKKYPCVSFEAGRCERGDSCTFSHVKKEDQKSTATVHMNVPTRSAGGARFRKVSSNI